jgi:ribosomal silencing factor RsfS
MKESLDVLHADEDNATHLGNGKKRKQKTKILVEGFDVPEPQWCIVDGGRAMVHIMTQRARETWDVEKSSVKGEVFVSFDDPDAQERAEARGTI